MVEERVPFDDAIRKRVASKLAPEGGRDPLQAVSDFESIPVGVPIVDLISFAAKMPSYRLCYHLVMPRGTKRSVSLPRDLAQEIDRAATRSGTTFSGWLAETAAHRLRLEAGRRGIAAWEREHGTLTAEELAQGRARARSLLGRSLQRAPRRSA